MKKNSLAAQAMIFWLGALLLTVAIGVKARADSPSLTDKFFDPDYGYSFKYPRGWKIRKLPEDVASQAIRVTLQGPDGDSFMVVVDKLAQSIAEKDFKSDQGRRQRVEELMAQTIDQIYRAISQNIRAKDMAVGQRRDLSNSLGLKFYLATLHHMPTGKPIVVAGIHAFPYGKDYSVNFLMTASYDRAATERQATLTAIFNSFHMLGEGRAETSESPNPSAESRQSDNFNLPSEKP